MKMTHITTANNWHCVDSLSGERFSVIAVDDDIESRVVEYIRAGIDEDTGIVGYDVTCTRDDGRELHFSGECIPD